MRPLWYHIIGRLLESNDQEGNLASKPRALHLIKGLAKRMTMEDDTKSKRVKRLTIDSDGTQDACSRPETSAAKETGPRHHAERKSTSSTSGTSESSDDASDSLRSCSSLELGDVEPRYVGESRKATLVDQLSLSRQAALNSGQKRSRLSRELKRLAPFGRDPARKVYAPSLNAFGVISEEVLEGKRVMRPAYRRALKKLKARREMESDLSA